MGPFPSFGNGETTLQRNALIFFMPLIRMIAFALFSLLMGLTTLAAEASPSSTSVEMADAMRSNGKIYVVLAVVLIIQVGLFAFLWILDRRLSRWEASNASKPNPN
jgi:hypothetical protein